MQQSSTKIRAKRTLRVQKKQSPNNNKEQTERLFSFFCNNPHTGCKIAWVWFGFVTKYNDTKIAEQNHVTQHALSLANNTKIHTRGRENACCEHGKLSFTKTCLQQPQNSNFVEYNNQILRQKPSPPLAGVLQKFHHVPNTNAKRQKGIKKATTHCTQQPFLIRGCLQFCTAQGKLLPQPSSQDQSKTST